MSNYTAFCRTNYFRVRDPQAFREAMDALGNITVHGDGEDGVCLTDNDPDGGGWPTWTMDEDGNEQEIDLPGIVAAHLAEGDVAVFMEIGWEKLRYLVGCAVAINAQGQRCHVSLDDIYRKAQRLVGRGGQVTRAEY